MAFEESPSLEEYKDGLPTKLPDPGEPLRKGYYTLGILFVLVLLLIVVNIIQTSGFPQLIPGKGTVIGLVLDDNGEPIVADIFVVGTDIEIQSDRSGYFEVGDIPKGLQSIIVAKFESGLEYVVNVLAGSTIDLGRILLISTPTAEE